jgi:hypothetical protein
VWSGGSTDNIDGGLSGCSNPVSVCRATHCSGLGRFDPIAMTRKSSDRSRSLAISWSTVIHTKRHFTIGPCARSSSLNATGLARTVGSAISRP